MDNEVRLIAYNIQDIIQNHIFHNNINNGSDNNLLLVQHKDLFEKYLDKAKNILFRNKGLLEKIRDGLLKKENNNILTETQLKEIIKDAPQIVKSQDDLEQNPSLTLTKDSQKNNFFAKNKTKIFVSLVVVIMTSVFAFFLVKTTKYRRRVY